MNVLIDPRHIHSEEESMQDGFGCVNAARNLELVAQGGPVKVELTQRGEIPTSINTRAKLAAESGADLVLVLRTHITKPGEIDQVRVRWPKKYNKYHKAGHTARDRGRARLWAWHLGRLVASSLGVHLHGRPTSDLTILTKARGPAVKISYPTSAHSETVADAIYAGLRRPVAR